MKQKKVEGECALIKIHTLCSLVLATTTAALAKTGCVRGYICKDAWAASIGKMCLREPTNSSNRYTDIRGGSGRKVLGPLPLDASVFHMCMRTHTYKKLT